MRRCTAIATRVILLMLAIAQVAAAQPLHVYFGNLHSHTSYSDGEGTPEEAYTHARDEAGLDFLAITDHNHLTGPGRIATDHELYAGALSISLKSTAGRFTEDGRFVAIYGQEFSSISKGNHANVLEVGAVIDTDDVPNGEWGVLLNTWLPAHLDSENKPALILLNHPAQSGSPNSKEYGIDDFAGDQAAWCAALDAHAQLINIVNGPSHGGAEPGDPSEGEFHRYLNLGLHVAPTADQDNHRRQWGSAADTRTGVVAASLTKPNILEALRNRHVYATEDRNLRIIAKVNDKLMGTRFQGDRVPNQGDQLRIEIDIQDDDEPSALYRIEVYADQVGGTEVADLVAWHDCSGNGTVPLNDITYDGGNRYLFFKIKQTDDDHVEVDRAWTAPVWFEPDGATEPLGVPVLTLEVNLQTEEATIANTGTGDVNLEGWTLVSVQGNQRFPLPGLTLQPGQALVVTSGPNAREELPRVVIWTTNYIWRNAGDPGQLLDTDGQVRATTE